MIAPQTLARVLGVQYVVGGILTLCWVQVPQGGPAEGLTVVAGLGLLALALGMLAVAISVAPVSDRTLTALAHGCIVSAQAVIVIAHGATRDPGGPLLLFLLWTTPYGALFSRRARWGHFASTAAAVVVVMAFMPADERWQSGVWSVGIVTTIVVVTLLVSRTTRQLHLLATRDELTGLPNRRLFLKETASALAGRHRQSTHVVLVDIDRFHAVNDTFGHGFGDALLTQVASRLASQTRGSDLLGRIGDDEFALLCQSPSGDAAREFVTAVTAALADPIEVAGHSLYATASIGVARASYDSTPDTLLRDADAAMHAAKLTGGDRTTFFDAQAPSSSPRLVALEQGLRQAVRRGELTLHYQPVMRLDDARPLGAEALVRWTSSELGPVSPDEFIGVAERCGLIREVGEWILDRALSDLSGWRRAGLVGCDFRVAVNLSPHQITDGLADHVAALLDKHAVDPANLGLEITESAVMADGVAERVLDSLHDLGVMLLLDDFGTGFSSLSHLRRFPLQVVKIDRSFVQGMCEVAEDHALVSGIVSLASALGLQVVAEGVESGQQLEQLRALGCAAAQGYGLARPVPADELPQALAAATITIAVPVARRDRDEALSCKPRQDQPTGAAEAVVRMTADAASTRRPLAVPLSTVTTWPAR